MDPGREYGIVTAVASSRAARPIRGIDHGQHHSDAVRRQADHHGRGIEQRHRPSRRGDEGGNYEIDLAGNIALTSALEAVNLASGVALDIVGGGFAINGENDQRGLFVYAGDVTVTT